MTRKTQRKKSDTPSKPPERPTTRGPAKVSGWIEREEKRQAQFLRDLSTAC